MAPGLLIAALLAADPGDARAELDACARRIEALKAHRKSGEEAGRELERLLRRAQDLAAELERTAAGLPPMPAPEGPSPDELRERADAARDEADRLAAEIAMLDIRIGDARRAAHLDEAAAVERAAFGHEAAPSSALLRVRELQARRAALSVQRAAAESEAARLDREARAAEMDR